MESGGQETPQILPTTRQLTKHVRKLRRAECICEQSAQSAPEDRERAQSGIRCSGLVHPACSHRSHTIF